MQITIEKGPNFEKTLTEMGQVGPAVRQAVHTGMEVGSDEIGTYIQTNLLSGQYLKVRTNELRNAVGGWMEGPLHAVIGVKPNSAVDDYAWLLGDNPANQPKTITPKNAKSLAIPVGENLSSAGVPKYATPDDAKRALGEKNFIFIPGTGKNIGTLGTRRGKTRRARFRPLFVLRRSVQVYDTGAIVDGVDQKLDDFTGRIQTEIDRVQS